MEELLTYLDLIAERESYVQMLDELRKGEPSRRAAAEAERGKVLSEIQKYASISRDTFRDKYNEILSESHIVEVIKQKGFHSKKEDMQRLGSYINSALEDAMNEILTDKAKDLSKKVDQFVDYYDKICKAKTFKGINMDGFNARRVFAAGLSGAAVYGGLAFWASTLGNLGAYILIAKGVSFLSMLGISVGGTAAAVSAVAAIGGPVVLGIALAVVASLGVFGVFSTGFEKKAAKKLRAAYDEQNALAVYIKCMDNFWNDTKVAFVAGSDEVEATWKAYISDLSDKVNNYDVAMLEQCVVLGRQMQDFFRNIPL